MKSKVKNNYILTILIYSVLKFILNILSLFIKKDKNMILFTSFSGRQFSDSPKVIYDKIRKDNQLHDLKLIWAFDKNAISHWKGQPDNVVRIDSLKYFILLIKSSIWITNSNIDRMLNFKPKKTLYINTWHGVPIKTLGEYEPNLNPTIKKWYRETKVSYLTFCGEYDEDKLSELFKNAQKSLKVGLPRNEELMNSLSDSRIQEIKEEIGVPLDKTILLYVPTFREYDVHPSKYFEWISLLNENYFVLYRGHYFTDSMEYLKDYDNIMDLSNYQNINNLYRVADILISDYSSAFFDYSLLEKPMIAYLFDHKQYKKNRGLYFELSEEINDTFYSPKSLTDYLNENNIFSNEDSISFKNKYMSYQKRNSSDYIIEIIKKHVVESGN